MELTDRQKRYLVAYLRATEPFQCKSYYEVGQANRYPDKETDAIVDYFYSDEANLLECASYPMARLTTEGRQRATLIFQAEGSGIQWSADEERIILELADAAAQSRNNNSISRPNLPAYEPVLSKLSAEKFIQAHRNTIDVYTELQWEANAIRRRHDASSPTAESPARRPMARLEHVTSRVTKSELFRFTEHPIISSAIIGILSIIGLALVAVLRSCGG
jgi:hypothetical protein